MFNLYIFVVHIATYSEKVPQFFLDLDFIEIWNIFIDDPLEGWYDEAKCAFMAHLGYSEKEFEQLATKLREKTHKYTREHMDYELLKGLMFDKKGNYIRTNEYLDLYDATQILKTTHYSVRDKNLLTSALTVPNIHLDIGQTDLIFEINRFPDLSQDVLLNNFNFENFISLRDKEGSRLLREIIFREENYNDPTELLREYNDIILREGIYTNKKSERAFWGLSNGLSLAGIFSGHIILTLVITAISVLSGNHRILYQSPNDKLESFIKADLRDFIDSVS